MQPKRSSFQQFRRHRLWATFAPLLLGALGAVLLAAYPGAARADESPFGHIYTTEVLPKGAIEVEQWMTWRTGKPGENFDNLQMRSEVEYGFSNRFLGAFYLNYERTNISPTGPSAPDGPENSTRFTAVSAEFIYQILNPYTEPFGFAVYFEPSIGNDERALEWKLLFQKNFLDDRLVLAANINIEYEWARDSGVWERESALEFYLGASYRIAPGWFLGAEFLNENGFEKHIIVSHAEAQANAFYMGPALHYASERWWATFALYRQLPWAGNPAGTPGAISGGLLTGEEETRIRFRLGVRI